MSIRLKAWRNDNCRICHIPSVPFQPFGRLNVCNMVGGTKMRKRRMKLLEEEERKMISIAITVVAALSIIIVTISYVIVVAIQTNHKMENGDHKLFTISCLMSQYDLPKLH